MLVGRSSTTNELRALAVAVTSVGTSKTYETYRAPGSAVCGGETYHGLVERTEFLGSFGCLGWKMNTQ